MSREAIMARFRLHEDQVRALDMSIKNARAAGNTQLAEALNHELLKKNAVHLKFKQTLAAYMQSQQFASARQQQQQSAQAQEQPQPPGQQTALPFPTQMSSPPPKQPQSSGPGSADNSAAANNNPTPDPRIATSGQPPPNANPNPAATQLAGIPGGPAGMQMPSSLTTQMQKLIEQERIRQPQVPAGNSGGPMAPNPNIIPPQNQDHMTTPGSVSGMGGANIPGPSQQSLGSRTPVWQGQLVWTGFDSSGGKKEMRTAVVGLLSGAVIEWYDVPARLCFSFPTDYFVATRRHGLRR